MASVQVAVINWGPTDSISPTMMPPVMAPPMLPSPPSTTMMNPLMSKGTPTVGKVL